MKRSKSNPTLLAILITFVVAGLIVLVFIIWGTPKEERLPTAAKMLVFGVACLGGFYIFDRVGSRFRDR